MFWKRSITISQPYNVVLDRLKQLKQVDVVTISSTESSFTLIKSVMRTPQRNVFRFYFKGTLVSGENGVRVNYRVFTGLQDYFVAIFVGVPLIKGILDIIAGSQGFYFVILGMLINAIFYGMIFYQARCCIKKFEMTL